MRPLRAKRVPVSEERRGVLRVVMGPEVWDTLEPHMPEGLVEAYDVVVEVLYGGDVTGVEEAIVTDGGKKATSKWPIRDSRVLPLKVWADHYATQAARAIQQASKAERAGR